MDYTIHKLCEHAFMLEHEINSELYRNIRTRRDRYLRKCLRRARDAYTLEMIQELEYHEDTFSVCCTLFEDIEYIVKRVVDTSPHPSGASVPRLFECNCHKFLEKRNAPQEASRTCRHIEAVKRHVFKMIPERKRLPSQIPAVRDVSPEAVREATIKGASEVIGILETLKLKFEQVIEVCRQQNAPPCLGLVDECKRKLNEMGLGVGGRPLVCTW